MKVLLCYDTMDLPETLVLKEMLSSDLGLHVIHNPNGKNHNLLEGTDIRLSPLICKSKLDFSAIKKLRQIIKEGDYDLVHAFTSRLLSATLLATLFLKKRPKIVAYRGAIGNIKRSDPTSWISFLNPRVSGINCVSKAVEDYLLSVGVPEKKLRTIYKGHRLEWYQAKEKKDLQEFGIKEQDFVVTCTANIRKTKGIDILIEAAKIINQELKIYFLIIGKIKDKDIQEIANSEKYKNFLHFSGFRTDASQLVGACDIFALPSRDREGLPKAVIEAMALGIPCIVSNVGGMPELIRDGKEGYVINKESVSELVDAIRKLYQDSEKRDSFGKAAKKRIEEEFHIEKTARETLDFYQQHVE